MVMVPDFDEFTRLAADFNTVPVYREIAADLDTPVSAFLKIHRGGYGFLLESVEGGELWGRYSFLGSNPLMVLRAGRGELLVSPRDGVEERVVGDPLPALAEVLAPFRQAAVPELGRFSGGFVGYLAYDLVRSIEKLPLNTDDDLGVADICGLIADNFIAFDNVSRTMKVVQLVFLDGRTDLRSAYGEAVAAIDGIVDLLSAAAKPFRAGDHAALEPPASNLTPREYGDLVEKAREYIRAGDVIQVVLSQRFSQPLASHPFSIYRALRTISPSPYMFYLDLGDEVAVGASPEMLTKIDGDEVSVRPIAGTIRRGVDEEENRLLVDAMLNDPKERAEHVMLLDLGRNDVGRVAKTGSVKVVEQMQVERYSHVNHIVSRVTGTLREGLDRFDAFASTFPAGTLSGAPKVRAMEIIEELEPTRRGIYGGGVGHVDFTGNMDTCIAIRTVLVKNDRVYLQVGAGIVADSDPRREQAECEAKARGMMVALEQAVELEKR
ncbi:MAG: anthranilate synthase component I [Candidatus Binatia bacterium]